MKLKRTRNQLHLPTHRHLRTRHLVVHLRNLQHRIGLRELTRHRRSPHRSILRVRQLRLPLGSLTQRIQLRLHLWIVYKGVVD